MHYYSQICNKANWKAVLTRSYYCQTQGVTNKKYCYENFELFLVINLFSEFGPHNLLHK